MKAWPIKRMDELCEVTSSKRIYAKELCSSGVPFFRSREIIEKLNGQETPSNPLFISEERFQEILRLTGAPIKGDVLLTSRGTLGVPYLVKDTDRFHFADGNLTWFRNFRQLDSQYLQYYFLSPSGKAELTKCVIGSSQAAYTIASLKKVEISLPPLSVQRRIAGILSAYDELIENNQRRIKILEEMARSLYREWIVNFRFPGHEKIPLVDSPLGPIPKGWEVHSFGDVCSSIEDGDWIETKDQGGNDYRLVQISNIGVGEFVETENFRFITQETLDQLHCNEIKPGDILISRMPKPIGRSWLVREMPWKMITAVDVAIVRVNARYLDPLYCVTFLNSALTLDRLAKHTTGTTRPRITRRDIAGFEILLPQLAVQKRFAGLVGGNFELAADLRSQIANLRRTRDLLLPRLLSGQISLEPLG